MLILFSTYLNAKLRIEIENFVHSGYPMMNLLKSRHSEEKKISPFAQQTSG